jgi:hypothetical protein
VATAAARPDATGGPETKLFCRVPLEYAAFCPSTRVARSSFTCTSIAFELSFRPVENARFEIFREML